MKKVKHLSILIIITSILLLIPIISNAADVTINRNYSSTGTFTFKLSGLSLDTSKTYKYGITSTSAETIEDWYDLTELTNSTATIVLQYSNSKIRSVINAGDKGYLSIKDSSDSTVLDHQEINLQIPYLLVTNYTKIDNGKKLGLGEADCINVPLRNASNSRAFYQYQKITDQNIIDNYNKIKSSNGNYLDLSNSLPTTKPTSGWTNWSYFNGYGATYAVGFGRPTDTISAPDKGLYLLWVYFQGGEGYKDIYGYILVDNLDGTSNTPNSSDNSGAADDSYDSEYKGGDASNKDNTLKPGSLPYTGVGVGITIAILIVVVGGIFTYVKYFKLRDI